MIERAESFLLAKRVDISAPMFLLIYAIDAAWLARHFSMACTEHDEFRRGWTGISERPEELLSFVVRPVDQGGCAGQYPTK